MRGSRWPTRTGQHSEPNVAERDPEDGGPADPDEQEREVAASTAVAKALGLRLLTGAPRSRAELAAAMARKEVPDDVASAVLDRFTEVGLLDDAEYARMLVRSRRADRGLARSALRQELRRKGIDDELAALALDTLDPDQEEETARRLAQRRLASTSDLPGEVRLRRVVAMLARKGYPEGLALRVVRDLLDNEGSTVVSRRGSGVARMSDPEDDGDLSAD